MFPAHKPRRLHPTPIRNAASAGASIPPPSIRKRGKRLDLFYFQKKFSFPQKVFIPGQVFASMRLLHRAGFPKLFEIVERVRAFASIREHTTEYVRYGVKCVAVGGACKRFWTGLPAAARVYAQYAPRPHV